LAAISNGFRKEMMDENKIVPRDRKAPIEIMASAPSLLSWEQAPREPHLLDYLRLLRKHQWLILTFLVTVVTLVSIATFKMKPVYEATARLEIDRDAASILPFQNMNSDSAMDDLQNYIETQSKVLQSDTLAMETIRKLNLINDPAFGAEPGGHEQLPVLSTTSEPITRPGVLSEFEGSLSVKLVPNTRLVDVTFEATDPKLAARVLNAHLEEFKTQNFKSHLTTSEEASGFLTGELEDTRQKFEAAEQKRLAYERDNQIWTVDEKQNITTQKLSEIDKELTEAQSDRIKKQADFNTANSGNIDAVPAIRESTQIASLTSKQSELRQQFIAESNRLGPNFPTVKSLSQQIKQLDELVANEKKNIIGRIEQDYHTALQRELLLTQSLDKQKVEANQMAVKLVEYNILIRDAEANKQLYDGLSQKLKEANISAGLHPSNIRIIDPAMVPSSPSRPNRARNILMAFLVGLVGGLGLAFLREYMDNTVKTPDDIERLAKLPSLAVVPAFASLDGSKRSRMSKLLNSASANGKDMNVELVSYSMPQSQVSEAFRSLRTSLLLSQAGHPPQVILVTSALPREGKTTAAVNLAVTLAQLGDRTLLIDADLRKPGVTRALSLQEGKYAGLSSYLAGVSSMDLVTVPHPVIPNLCVVPTGPIPPNPADLLSSARMQQGINELRSEYKFIVVDSPPVMAATDAVILSVLVDGVLLVVRSGETPKEAFTRTRDLLTGVKCRMLGVLLNAVDSNAPDYYYSYRYYPYSYGGYSHEEKESKKTAASA
jgi:succinoglycan biosynthesis transport protein ExoP